MLRDLPRKQSQGLIVQPACSSSGYLSCPLWRRVQHLPFSSHQGSPFISMNIQSDLDISVISLNTHRCSPWDPKGVWYAQESKQSKLGKAFWVQRHGGKYWDACEEWSNVKLEQGGIFLFVFVSVSLSIGENLIYCCLQSYESCISDFSFILKYEGAGTVGQTEFLLVGYCR